MKTDAIEACISFLSVVPNDLCHDAHNELAALRSANERLTKELAQAREAIKYQSCDVRICGIKNLLDAMEKIRSALDDSLGDTDPDTTDMTEEEIREQEPVFWACQLASSFLGDTSALAGASTPSTAGEQEKADK